jgi:hypothetical protein
MILNNVMEYYNSHLPSLPHHRMNPLAALAALLACAALTLPAAATELPPEFAAAIKAAGLPLDAVGRTVPWPRPPR